MIRVSNGSRYGWATCMARPGPPAAVLAGLSLALAACGSTGSTARCSPTPHPSIGPPEVVDGPVTASAGSGVVALGSTAHVAVRVVGPASYQAPCEGPVRMIVVDSSDMHLYTDTPPAPRGTPCGAVTLAAGQHAEYDLSWPVDPTLPTGGYRLLLALGNQPDMVLPLHVGPIVDECAVPVGG